MLALAKFSPSPLVSVKTACPATSNNLSQPLFMLNGWNLFILSKGLKLHCHILEIVLLGQWTVRLLEGSKFISFSTNNNENNKLIKLKGTSGKEFRPSNRLDTIIIEL